LEYSDDNTPDAFTLLIRAVLERALADFVEAYGREGAILKWAALVDELGADAYLDPREIAGDLTMALGDIEQNGLGHEDVLPPAGLPDDLYALFAQIAEVAIHRQLLERLGYPDPPARFMFNRFVTRSVMTGGMGMVIEAYDPQLARMVAIKLWLDAAPAAQAALLAEAKLLAQLCHPNVVTIHETGRWGERVFFVMQWVEGMDGHQWLQEPRLWREVLKVFLAAGEGLAAAHAANIQHRDFKPGNILIGNDGKVVVADFGVADSLGTVDADDDDAPIMVVGTRCYVAPERLRRGRGDARSDQFSFCVALWEALHGRRPYAGQSRSDVLESIERGEIRTGPQTDQVPRPLNRVVRKGLADDPDQRYPSMRELLEALREEPSESELEALGDAGSFDPSPPNGGLLNTPREETDMRVLLQELHGEPAESERPGERVTVTSQASAAWRGPSWATFVGAVVAALAAGVALTLAVLAPTEPSRARGDEYAATETSEGSSPATEPPCVLTDDDALPVDPVVLEVCRLILRDDFVEAGKRWWQTYEARRQAARPIGGDALIIARTAAARGDAIRRTRPDTADEADGFARYWAGEAAVGLPKTDPRRREAKHIRDGR